MFIRKQLKSLFNEYNFIIEDFYDKTFRERGKLVLTGKEEVESFFEDGSKCLTCNRNINYFLDISGIVNENFLFEDTDKSRTALEVISDSVIGFSQESLPLTDNIQIINYKIELCEDLFKAAFIMNLYDLLEDSYELLNQNTIASAAQFIEMLYDSFLIEKKIKTQ